METNLNPAGTGSGLPYVAVRHLRHEFSNLLQSIYSSVAILQQRLPADSLLERRVLADLLANAQGCKGLLERIQDLATEIKLSFEPVDLAEKAASLVAAAAARHPRLKVDAVAVDTPCVSADVGRLDQLGGILLEEACQVARRHVRFRTAQTASGEVEWSVSNDGADLSADPIGQMWDRRPLGLALVRKLVSLHGGRMSGTNLPEEGFRICIYLPARPENQEGEHSLAAS